MRAENLRLGREGRGPKFATGIERETILFDKVVHSLNEMMRLEGIAVMEALQGGLDTSKTITWATFIFTLIAVGFSGVIWFFLSGSLVKPIEKISAGIDQISGGDLSARVPVSSGDEIGHLAEVINEMAKRLEGLYETLDQKVKNRTADLQLANEELHARKQELELLTKELMAANKLKSQFLANVSHELRTPLNSILGFSELLLEKSFGPLTGKQKDYASFIHGSGSHLLQLINTILDLSKIDSGRMEVHLENFSLKSLIDEIMGIVTPQAMDKEIDMKTHLDESIDVIAADRSMVKQIFLNLLSNSLKFSEVGGRITLRTDAITGLGNQGAVKVTVTDTGIGIEKEDIEKIFGEFMQVDHSLTRKHGGTGLGLTLSKKMVELHGGEMTVESDPGKMTSFIFTLPLKGEKQSEPTLSSVNPNIS